MDSVSAGIMTAYILQKFIHIYFLLSAYLKKVLEN